jgi:hypothetical protein
MKKTILLIFLIFLYGCVSDPERLAPPEYFKTGMANYLAAPLNTYKLATEGYTLDTGYNIFVWPQQYNNIQVGEALISIKGLYHYVYDYDDNQFYFPEQGLYAQLKTHPYYSKNLFTTLKSEHRYAIYMSKDGILKL